MSAGAKMGRWAHGGADLRAIAGRARVYGRLHDSLNDASVPTQYGHRQVWVKGHGHEVVIPLWQQNRREAHTQLQARGGDLRSAALSGADRTEDPALIRIAAK